MSLAPELDVDLSGRRGDDAQDRERGGKKQQLIGQQHPQPPLPHPLLLSARRVHGPGAQRTLLVHGACTGVCGARPFTEAPFLSSSPRYEISPVAYMHTQEDAGKKRDDEQWSRAAVHITARRCIGLRCEAQLMHRFHYYTETMQEKWRILILVQCIQFILMQICSNIYNNNIKESTLEKMRI